VARILVCSLVLALLVAAPVLAGTKEDNKEVVRRMIEAINARDFDALDAVVAADVRRHSAATPGVEVRSLEELKAFLRQDLSAVPDAIQETRAMIAEGDLVAVRELYRGHQSGPMGPFPATGKPLEIPFLGFLRIEEGKVAEIWVEWDNMAALTELGHLEPPAPPGAPAETAAEEEPGAEPSIEDFAWLVGQWQGEALGGVAEEVWLAPAGGAMSGMFRTVSDGAIDFYELFTIAEPELDLRLKHFGADLVGWEAQEEVVTFPFVRVSPAEAVFEGLVFRRIAEDRIQAVVETRQADGTEAELVFDYQRLP